MSTPLFTIFHYPVTPWHMIGALGFAIFTSRWLIQIMASRKAKKSIFPSIFWYASIAGSTLLMLYFWESKHDAVGVLSNALPFALASYNVALIKRPRKNNTTTDISS